MLRLGIAATNTLAGRSASATGSALPPAAVAAVAALRCTALEPTSCSCSCLCPSSAWPTVNRQRAHSCRRAGRLRGASTLVSAAPPSTTAAPPPPPAAATAACDPSSYQSLSLVVLLHECTRRAYGRPLLESGDLLALPTQLDSLPCCVVLLAPEPRLLAVPSASAPASLPSQPPPSPGSGAHGGESSASGPSSGSSGSSSSADGDASGPLRVQYLNRAAAEALKASCSGSSSNGGGGGSSSSQQAAVPRTISWPLLDADEGGAELLCAVLAARGPPRRGQLRSLTLATGGGRGRSAVGGGEGPGAVTCPEALVLELMSPNGTCAGAALLFDRWEVRLGGRGGDGGSQVLLAGRPLVPEIPPGSQPSEEALTALQERVRGQADGVRALKSQQGLTNQDPRVVAAVACLQQLKAELELQQRLQAAFGVEEGVVRQLAAAAE